MSAEKGKVGIITVLLLILVTVSASLVVYLWFTEYAGKQRADTTETAERLKIEGVTVLADGSISVYVRNIGDYIVNVDRIMIMTPTGLIVADFPIQTSIEPGKVKSLTFPGAAFRQNVPSQRRYLIKVSSRGAAMAFSYVEGRVINEALQTEAPPLCLLANTSSIDDDRFHWVVFRYDSGKYYIYGNYGVSDPPELVKEGTALILSGVDSYTITTEWVSWEDRPVDTPVILVFNPKMGKEDWVFTWVDPHGTHRFYLQGLSEQAAVDFLVFWEDLFYPAEPPSQVDDWKDHVVRVTLFTNNTYRIAVFLAKGGYSHKFYLPVTVEFERVPWDQSPVYTKPFGATWSNVVDGYYREMSDKVYFVTP